MEFEHRDLWEGYQMQKASTILLVGESEAGESVADRVVGGVNEEIDRVNT